MYFKFKDEVGNGTGSGEVFQVTAENRADFDLDLGWYWWACWPGCLPDGAAVGPFKTERAAVNDAQELGVGRDLV
jgi:hypothetical protein